MSQGVTQAEIKSARKGRGGRRGNESEKNGKHLRKSRRSEQKKTDNVKAWVTFCQRHRDRRCERGWHAIVRLHTLLVIDGHGLFHQAFNALLSSFFISEKRSSKDHNNNGE